MDKDKEILQNVDKAFQSIDSIESVDASPFFKDKVMQQIANAKSEVPRTAWNWFSPQLQLTLLVAVIVLNVIAYIQMNTSNYNEEIDSIAQMYGLSESENNEIQFN
ncbi:hypothetical protein [Winogradskyella sp. 3972H.M.0a.05]|uniref:hypothetical protein n=1 Tax=Winogradskyella sp. 3972H.M.0a.05 TaxID=2950277 RepID=UPI00339A1ABC